MMIPLTCENVRFENGKFDFRILLPLFNHHCVLVTELIILGAWDIIWVGKLIVIETVFGDKFGHG
jgi:hypothetical protein